MIYLLVIVLNLEPQTVVAQFDNLNECKRGMTAFVEVLKAEHEEGWKPPKGFDLYCVAVPVEPVGPGKDSRRL